MIGIWVAAYLFEKAQAQAQVQAPPVLDEGPYSWESDEEDQEPLPVRPLREAGDGRIFEVQDCHLN